MGRGLASLHAQLRVSAPFKEPPERHPSQLPPETGAEKSTGHKQPQAGHLSSAPNNGTVSVKVIPENRAGWSTVQMGSAFKIRSILTLCNSPCSVIFPSGG